MAWQLIHADCLEAMAAMDEASVDAIVTDPPYLLAFMGKAWDANLNHGLWATEALRVLKPGGHLLAFGGTRTYHRLACALEDAGFEIRDCLAWLYGSGFPKSLDVSKAIDKAAGEERGRNPDYRNGPNTNPLTRGNSYSGGWDHRGEFDGGPATPEAERWQGWGTALKPAFEPIVLARKPLVGSVATNVERFGTGALNIDGARIAHDADSAAWVEKWSGDEGHPASTVKGGLGGRFGGTPLGRWPANLILDEEAAHLLDEQTGDNVGGSPGVRHNGAFKSVAKGAETPREAFGYDDTGGASRFFKVVEDEPCELHGIRRCTICLVEGSTQHGIADLSTSADTAGPGEGSGSAQPVALPSASRFRYVPKADREERDRGLEHRDESATWAQTHDFTSDPRMAQEQARNGSRNPHPTVKPVELMRWLVKLITPPGGTVLDPFTGSGSTGIAALREGFDFIGIEREADYVEIARARIQGDAPLFNIPAEVGVESTP